MIMSAPADRKSPEELAFTELHALTMADIDGDGLQDIVTGKRWWSHGYRYDEEDDLVASAGAVLVQAQPIGRRQGRAGRRT